MKYEIVTGKPVPRALAAELRALQSATGATLTSCARNQAAVNWARGKGYALSSQKELWDLYLAGRGNPANPPGYSTHEFRSDGVAFAIPRGWPIRYWMVGQDWGDGYHARAVCAAARKRGWVATITYPTNPREQHHVNFRKEPVLKVFRNLKRGSKGRRVRKLRKRLGYVHDPNTHKPYIHKPGDHKYFGEVTEKAVKAYQRDHGLKPDGIYGYHTHKQLLVSARRRARRLEEERKK